MSIIQTPPLRKDVAQPFRGVLDVVSEATAHSVEKRKWGGIGSDNGEDQTIVTNTQKR